MDGKVFEVREPLMLISIAGTAKAWPTPYEAVRYAWRIDPARASRFGLVLARLGDRVVGAYRPDEWLPATTEHFPGRPPSEDRWGFNGAKAGDVWDYYVERAVPERFRRSTGNPIKYCMPGD